ncbi:MAG: hypothetical protein H7Y13_14585 [Sphingobacteriaceae bacterium]|nr:hypothetical protein [Sphingobacteriaceae bacterium]
MKSIFFIFILAFVSCGPGSSPEGRMNMKLETIRQELDSLNKVSAIQSQLDTLKARNKILSDSISLLNKEVKALSTK